MSAAVHSPSSSCSPASVQGQAWDPAGTAPTKQVVPCPMEAEIPSARLNEGRRPSVRRIQRQSTAEMTPQLTEPQVRRQLLECMQRYAKEFRRRNNEVKQEMEAACSSIRTADRLNAELMRRLQILQLLIYGCYTKQPTIVATSLQVCNLLASQDLLVEYDRQLLAQLLTEMADSSLQLPEIGATALACALTPNRLSGAYLGKAIGVCLRQQCCIADLHRLAALVLDRVPQCHITEDVVQMPSNDSPASPTHKAPPKDAATADAFALLQDVCELSESGHSKPGAWLHGVSEVSPLVAFDVVAYAVHNRAALLLDGGQLEQLLHDKVFPALSAGLQDAACTDELFLRLCVLAHLLLRNYSSVPRMQPACAQVLRSLLRCLPSLSLNRRCMVLQAWASLLTRVRGPTVSLYFSDDLCATVEWLCEALQAVFKSPVEEATTEVAYGAYVAFRDAHDVTLKDAQLAIDLEWFCSKQRTSFSPPEARFLLFAALRALLVSLNSVQAQCYTEGTQELSAMLTATCKPATATLAALVWRCVHRVTEQNLALSLETLFELGGRSGHGEVCRAILELHRSVVDDCLTRLQTDPTPETAERLATFAMSCIRLVSEYAPFIPSGRHGWPVFCELLAGVVAYFDFPLFTSNFETAAGAPPPGTEPESCINDDAGRSGFQQELLYEIEAFAPTTSRFPLKVLRGLLDAEFAFGQAADKEDSGRIFFVMAKVTEVAIYNLKRFHAFAGQWLSNYVLLFFVESTPKVPGAARSCFSLVFDRLVPVLEVTPAGMMEEAIVAALHLLESCQEADLMALQIVCLRRLLEVLNIRTATNVGGDFKTLVALPDLLRRHSQLPHAENVRASAQVFSAFTLSPTLKAAPPGLRCQACERGLLLGLELLRQDVDTEVTTQAPVAIGRLLGFLNVELQTKERHDDLEAFLLEQLSELEALCRDQRACVAAEASILFFDVLRGTSLTLPNRLFSTLVSGTLFSGFKAFISSFKANPENAEAPQKIDAFANYILNAASCIIRRYSEDEFRPHMPIDLWFSFFLCLNDAWQLAIEPITFAVLAAFSQVSNGLARIEKDENMPAIRAALWKQGLGIAWEAAQREWRITTEVLLPDTVLLLCDLFALRLPNLDSSQRKNCVDLTVQMIQCRSQPVISNLSFVAKERSLLSLMERVCRGLFEDGSPAGRQLVSDLFSALCDVFFEEVTADGNMEPKWPQPHHLSYVRLAFSLMSEFTTKVVSKRNGPECSRWLTQHMQFCEKPSRFQYRCFDLHTWRGVHNCVATAIDSLVTAVEVCGSDEDLAAEYERFLSCHLFSTEKHSRFLSSADFLEHQAMERELLANMRDFVSAPNGSQSTNRTSMLHTRLSRYLVTQLGSKAHISVSDAVVNPQTAGPSTADEFFDSRHWRFQIACVEALVTIVHSLKNVPRQDGYACCQVFDAYISYAKEALSSFHDRLEVRCNEPLPAVCYYEVTAIVETLKDVLNGGEMNNVFIPSIVELYPYLVDLVTILQGRLLNEVLEVLHAYKAFMTTNVNSQQSSFVGDKPPRTSIKKNFFTVFKSGGADL